MQTKDRQQMKEEFRRRMEESRKGRELRGARRRGAKGVREPKGLILITGEKIEIPIKVTNDWEYKSSVERFTNLYGEFKNLYREVATKGKEVVIEVAIAHKALTDGTKHKGSAKWEGKTFKDWCDDVGLHPNTPRNWFQKYLPEYYSQIQYKPFLGTENSVLKQEEAEKILKEGKEWKERPPLLMNYNDLDDEKKLICDECTQDLDFKDATLGGEASYLIVSKDELEKLGSVQCAWCGKELEWSCRLTGRVVPRGVVFKP